MTILLMRALPALKILSFEFLIINEGINHQLKN